MSLPYDFPQTQQDIERSENAIVAPLAIGTALASEYIYAESAATLGLTTLGTVSIALVGGGAILHGDTNPKNYGEGPIDFTLPLALIATLPAALSTYTDIPIAIPTDIPNQKPDDGDKCSVYVIWQTTVTADVEIAKYRACS